MDSIYMNHPSIKDDLNYEKGKKVCKNCNEEFIDRLFRKDLNLWRTGSRKYCYNCISSTSNGRRILFNIPEEYRNLPSDQMCCTICKIPKDISQFKSCDRWCKSCTTEYKKNRSRNMKLLAVERLGGCCSKCGYSSCIDALDFHHTDPTKKEFSVSDIRKGSLKKYLSEVDKCVLLCANCHRELHSESA